MAESRKHVDKTLTIRRRVDDVYFSARAAGEMSFFVANRCNFAFLSRVPSERLLEKSIENRVRIRECVRVKLLVEAVVQPSRIDGQVCVCLSIRADTCHAGCYSTDFSVTNNVC